MMYGRGRGSYLGILLESQSGKTALGAVNDKTEVKVENEVSDDNFSSQKQSGSPLDSAHSQDNEKKSTQPTWTPLDLLGNIGKRNRQGSDTSLKQIQDSSQIIEDERKRDLKNGLASTLLTSSIRDSEVVPDQIPPSNTGKKIHLISPQEFLLSPQTSSSVKDEEANSESSERASSTETCESSNSSSSPYIPPHRRKGFSGQPQLCPDPSMVPNYKNQDLPRVPLVNERTHSPDAQTLVESELNWHKWKLQRSFKKILNNLSVENVVGLSVDIKEVCDASQLSTRFPGASEVNALVDLLVSRVIDQKESMEVAVQICRLLNAMYKDEFPANLKDVLRQFRQETFSGVASKNSGCENFCIFLGKLCDVAKNETKSFQDCLRQSVVGCLHDWISLFQAEDELSQEAELKASYLCYLLEVTKSVLSTEKRLWIKSCFGKIKNCILCEKLARSVKENLLDHIIKCSLQSPTAKEIEGQRMTAVSNSHSADDLDAYKNVKIMLSDLELSHLLQKFQDNLIRDTLLRADKNELKNTLQEAGFAPGAILEIQLYLEKNGNKNQVKSEENTVESKSDGNIDSHGQVKNLEGNLKLILASIEVEKQKRVEKQNKDEEQNEEIAPLDSREVESKLMNNECRLGQAPDQGTLSYGPPPGFITSESENRRTSSPVHKDAEANNNEECTRDVSLKEKKNNIMEFKDVESQAGNPVVNLAQNQSGSFQRKGRGRGRRDVSGSLDYSKREFTGDARGPRWNSRGVKGFQHGLDKDKPGYVDHSPETSRKEYNRHQSSWRDVKGYSWKDDSPSKGKLEDMDRGHTATSARDTSCTNTKEDEVRSASPADAGFGTPSAAFVSSAPIGCFICGAKDHRSAYCKNNAAMFD